MIKSLIGSSAASVANGFINQYFQKQAAQYNLDLAEHAAQNEYSRQLDFWRKQNNYNDPRNQVARMVAAGLSPVDIVDSGNASALSSVPGNDFAKGGAIQPQQLDLIGAVKTFSEIRQIGKQGDKIDQEVANLIADQYLKSLDGQLRELGLDELAEKIEGLRLDNVGKSFDNRIKSLVANRTQLENDNQFDAEYYKVLKTAALLTVEKTLAETNSLNMDNFRKSWEQSFQKEYGLPYEVVKDIGDAVFKGFESLTDLIPKLGKASKVAKKFFNSKK